MNGPCKGESGTPKHPGEDGFLPDPQDYPDPWDVIGYHGTDEDD